jgi:hypothetical protein
VKEEEGDGSNLVSPEQSEPRFLRKINNGGILPQCSLLIRQEYDIASTSFGAQHMVQALGTAQTSQGSRGQPFTTIQYMTASY